MEELCHQFERDQEGTVLAEYPPQVIANTLKLYFRQLPEVRASEGKCGSLVNVDCHVMRVLLYGFGDGSGRLIEVDIKVCMSVRLTASITNF